mmetsp:Transcript_29673/g.86474  ORF Transcript_29673/g.86474 Transcript_29673/m.86474 type:complete len:271 (+) Transcript_29673:256-1068(+)
MAALSNDFFKLRFSKSRRRSSLRAVLLIIASTSALPAARDCTNGPMAGTENQNASCSKASTSRLGRRNPDAMRRLISSPQQPSLFLFFALVWPPSSSSSIAAWVTLVAVQRSNTWQRNRPRSAALSGDVLTDFPLPTLATASRAACRSSARTMATSPDIRRALDGGTCMMRIRFSCRNRRSSASTRVRFSITEYTWSRSTRPPRGLSSRRCSTAASTSLGRASTAAASSSVMGNGSAPAPTSSGCGVAASSMPRQTTEPAPPHRRCLPTL